MGSARRSIYGAFRGLWLNRGTNQIVMSYWPENFTAWAAIGILSALMAGGGAIFGGLSLGPAKPCAR
jgi:hypothetical protein